MYKNDCHECYTINIGVVSFGSVDRSGLPLVEERLTIGVVLVITFKIMKSWKTSYEISEDSILVLSLPPKPESMPELWLKRRLSYIASPGVWVGQKQAGRFHHARVVCETDRPWIVFFSFYIYISTEKRQPVIFEDYLIASHFLCAYLERSSQRRLGLGFRSGFKKLSPG